MNMTAHLCHPRRGLALAWLALVCLSGLNEARWRQEQERELRHARAQVTEALWFLGEAVAQEPRLTRLLKPDDRPDEETAPLRAALAQRLLERYQLRWNNFANRDPRGRFDPDFLWLEIHQPCLGQRDPLRMVAIMHADRGGWRMLVPPWEDPYTRAELAQRHGDHPTLDEALLGWGRRLLLPALLVLGCGWLLGTRARAQRARAGTPE